MSEKEKAVPDGSNIGNGKEETTVQRTAETSMCNSTLKDSCLQALLPKSRENAMTAAELAALTGEEPRRITIRIQRMRLRGVPICASSGVNSGYWVSSDPKEISDYCGSLDGRLHNIRMTRTAIGETLAQMTGQFVMQTENNDG